MIPTVGRVDALVKCLRSLAIQSTLPKEVIVVPCRQAQEVSVAIARLNLPYALRVIRSEECNASAQKNLGAGHAIGDIVHFMDDDVELDPNYIHEIEVAYVRYPDAAGVGGRILESSTPWPLMLRVIRRLFLLNHDSGSGDFLPSGFPAMPFAKRVEVPMPTRLLMGCASYRRNVLASYHFDEELGRTHLWEDIDLPARLSKAHLLLYQPSAVMVHHHAPGGRFDMTRYAYAYVYNHHYLAAKHGRPGLRFVVAFWWGHLGAFLAMIFRAARARTAPARVISAMVSAERDWFTGRRARGTRDRTTKADN